MHARSAVALTLTLTLTGCGSSETTPPASPTEPAPPSHPSSAPTQEANTQEANTQEASAQEASAQEASATNAALEAEVRALVDAWLTAQNAGDREAYEALYAARFYGVKRSGPRTYTFDRAGWMANRRPMFARPMEVTARDVLVTAVGDTASVRLTQGFVQGRYRDEGPKVLTVVREGGALRIAREEMLASTLAGDEAENATGALAPGALLPILTIAGRRYAALAPVPEGATWSTGAPSLVERAVVVVTREAAGGVPAALASLAGQRLVVGDAHGARCEVTAGPLEVLSRVDVHFGVEQRWDGLDPDGDGPRRPATPSQIARDAWGPAQVLVAPLEGADCAGSTGSTGATGATFARLATLPAATVFAQSAADATLTTSALAAFRATPAWAALDASFHELGVDEELPPADAHWDGRVAPEVTAWRAGERTFVTVTATGGGDGCADFHGALWSVFEVTPAGLVARTSTDAPGALTPLAAVDVDGDGAPEWVVEDGLALRPSGATSLGLAVDLSPARLDCDC